MSTDTLNRPEVKISNPSPSPVSTIEPFFSRQEIRQFDSDDAEAGRRIGKILTSLFIYTLIAMSIVIWWTLRTVGH
jgi:hypothetical protein